MHTVLRFLLVSACLFTGCVSSRVIENTRVPEIAVDEFGKISINGESVEPGKVAGAIQAAGIRRDQEVNILVPERFDTRLRDKLSAEMVRNGYTRTVFVTPRKASATVKPKR